MIELLAVAVLLAVNNAALYYGLRRHQWHQRTLARGLEDRWEDRWKARLQKCDEILALAERAEQRTHEGLVEIARAQERTQDHLLAMERITTDPRVVQALR